MFKWLADRAPVARRVREEEQGFTLIELLIVVIIIGILAAIAIPVFLNQREGAQDSAAQGNLRSAATAQQAYRTDNNSYGADAAAVQNYGFNQGEPEVEFTSASASAFCLNVTSDSGATFSMTQDDGSPQTTPCT